MFDFSNTEEESFELIPKMFLPFTVTNAEWKDSSSGGEYLKVEFTVIGEKYNGRKVWLMYNFVNANEKAVNIAKAQYLSLVLSMGYNKKDMTNVSKEKLIEMILGKQTFAEVIIKKGSGDYADSNSLRNFKEYEMETPSVSFSSEDIPF